MVDLLFHTMVLCQYYEMPQQICVIINIHRKSLRVCDKDYILGCINIFKEGDQS